MSWPKKPLAEVADFQLGKMLDQVKNRGDSRPYLANKNVRWGNFDFSELREMRFEESEFERFCLKNGDIVMCEGGEPGRCAIWRDELPNMMFQKALHRIRPFEGMDSVFLYYNLSHRARSGHFNGLLTGATIKHLPREKLALVQVDVPDLPTQQRIAGILSAYDDLIENNRRRIGLLEQAARLIYREWFVHLRFPGHETAKIVDGLPEGWVLKRVTDICTVARGASPRPIQNFLDGTVPWFKIGDATASESPFVFDTKEKIIEEGVKRSVFLPAGEMILSNSATCGVPNFTAVDGCIHDGWLYFKDLRHISKEHLFLFFESKQREMLQGIGEGAVQKNFNTEYVGRQVLPLPQDPALIAEFSDRVQPMFAQIKAFATHNRALTRARDLLLPRLMDGRIPV